MTNQKTGHASERALITVAGKDTVGVVYQISRVLAEENVNIINLTQQLMEGYFTMMLLVDLTQCKMVFADLQSALKAECDKLGMTVNMQDTELFDAMYRV